MSPVPAEEPKVRAERLFAGLTDQTGPGGSFRPSDAESPAPVGTSDEAADPIPQRELRDFLVAARIAIERTAKAVKVVRARVATTTADLRALGEAIEEALLATNDRLASLEQLVLGEMGPGAPAADDAMRRLRSTLQATERPPES